MVLLGARNAGKSFGQNSLFQNVTFEISENDKIGLIGVNGAGKTTLFKILTGRMAADEGEVFRSKITSAISLDQVAQAKEDATAYEAVLSAFESLMEVERRLEEVRLELEAQQGDLDALVRRQHQLHSQFEDGGGLTYRSRARSALLGLGFTEADFETPFKNLSGGQQTRVMLGKILLSEANLLLLDEPTNHLDIAAVEWLEDFLKDYRGAYIVISHDRYFLDRVTGRTFELENGTLTAYNGNYSVYVRQKEENRLALERKYENTQKEIRRLEAIIEQQRRWNREKNIVTAESKQKVVDRLEKTLVAPSKTPEAIRFSLEQSRRGGNDVLLASGLAKAYGGVTLFSGVDLHIRKGERVFLLGPNGCGKTTLFKIILGLVQADAGQVRLGAGIETGYYDQTQSGMHPGNTAMEEISAAYPQMDQTAVRGALGAFLFRGDDVFKPISALSGGEAARVAILKLMLSRANFLMLDEPTNHLDIGSCEALEQALQEYAGTLFMISHDRYFINKLADRILCFDADGGLKETTGGYDDYLASLRAPETVKVKQPPKPNAYLAKKEEEAAKRRLLGQIGRTEKRIHELEEKAQDIQRELEQPETACDYEKVLSLTGEMDACQREIDGLYHTWGELHESLEQSAGAEETPDPT